MMMMIIIIIIIIIIKIIIIIFTVIIIIFFCVNLQLQTMSDNLSHLSASFFVLVSLLIHVIMILMMMINGMVCLVLTKLQSKE